MFITVGQWNRSLYLNNVLDCDYVVSNKNVFSADTAVGAFDFGPQFQILYN